MKKTKMSSEKFIRAAKKITMHELVKHDYRGANKIGTSDIEVVWYNHTLGNKKCLLYIHTMSDRYVEVTYNNNKDELYVDIYKHKSNAKYSGQNIIESM